MILQACNDFVWVMRDKPETESGGLIIPGVGREKPHQGTVISIGDLVQDKNIKKSKGKKALFHKTVGQEITFDGKVYLILEGRHIIGIV